MIILMMHHIHLLLKNMSLWFQFLNPISEVMFLLNGSTLRHDDAELSQESATMVNQRGTLHDKKLSSCVQRANGLLFNGFDGGKTHIGSTYGLTNRFRIVGVVFTAFTVWDNKLGVHEFDGMTELANLSSPVLRGGTGFDADETGFSLSEE